MRRILRSAWATHPGTELGTEGDSFFVAFESAAEGRWGRRLRLSGGWAGHSWPAGERVRVRIGIHTGAPGQCEEEDGYVGMDVHRCCARGRRPRTAVRSSVSDATADLVEVPAARWGGRCWTWARTG